MTINLKPINLYQELDPYDIDVDNRPLLDIQDNITQIAELLGDLGFYSEILADPSQEPAGGFTPFTCACVYSNSLLVPIDISNSVFTIDYASYPIVLILGAKNAATQAYPCLFFSAGITLANKFASFVPGSQGRLLRVGPGGELVDQMYYDLAHAAKSFQALYVGKILGPTSIVFGGNQVSVLGNNFYIAKNRDDSTSGLVVVQRSNSDSNTVFKTVNVNEVGSTYVYAEFVNNSVLPSNSTVSPAPIYFAIDQLPFDQSTGSFVTQSLEASLNEIHFSTPSVNTYTGATQTYLTSGINVRGLLDFASVNTIHAPSYSNDVYEVGQGISTKLIFMDRAKTLTTDPDIPIGIQYNSPIISVGTAITAKSNQPANILPTIDTTGITVSDYFNTAGGYIGGIQDNGGKDSNGVLLRTITPEQDAATQAAAGFAASGIKNNATKTFVNAGIHDYDNSFTLLISSKSATSTPSNILISTDGYLNLSSVNGTLVNKMPILDTEITPKIYVDNAVYTVATSANNKIPLTGTTDPDGTKLPTVSGIIAFDVTKNATSLSQVLSFNSTNSADILSTYPINFFGSDGATPQRLFAATVGSSTGIDVDMLSVNRGELVNKEFLSNYVTSTFAGSAYVTLAGFEIITGNKTVTGLFTFQNNTVGSVTSSNLALVNASSGVPITFSVGGDSALTISGTKPIKVAISTAPGDNDLSLVTKDYVDGAVSGSGGKKGCAQFHGNGTSLSLSGSLVEESNLIGEYFTMGAANLTCLKACMCMVTFSFNAHTGSGADQTITALLSLSKNSIVLSRSDTNSWASSASNNRNREELSTSITAAVLMDITDAFNFSLAVTGSGLEASNISVSVMAFGV